MPYAREIRKFAAEIGRHAKQRSVYLKHELKDIKSRKAEIEAYLHSTTLLQERLARHQGQLPQIEILEAKLVTARFYCEQLERAAWRSEIWGKFRSRMNDLIRNCEIPSNDRKKHKF